MDAVGLGYLGVFLALLIANSSIFFHIPGWGAIPIAVSAGLNPYLVAGFASMGASIGELTAYAAGYAGSRLVLESRMNLQIWKSRFQRYGGFLIILIFAATPLPHDLVGLLGGALRYSISKFFLATLIGKFLLYLGIALASAGILPLLSEMIRGWGFRI